MPTLDRQNDVFILNLGDTENRFHPTWISEISTALDEVAAAEGPRSLVTTATGKFYSNGLDLEWLTEHQDHYNAYIVSVEHLLARLLSLPLITVTAIQGHAYAAGAMLSLVHDIRLMRADRGFWCLPEVDINIPFTNGMAELIRSRLAPQTAHRAMLTSARYGGTDASTAGIVDAALSADALVDAAIEVAEANTHRAGETLSITKEQMYRPVLELLRHT